MIYLNNKNIESAFISCTKHNKIKVLIVSEYYKTIQEVHKELNRLIYRYDNKIKTVLMNDTKYDIKFKNGSLIKTLILSDCFKGERFHIILVDEQMDKNIYRVVLRPMENLWKITRSEKFCERE